MSMSQEEIEALMNGLDIDESESDNESTQEEASNDDNSTVSQEELDELVSNSNVEDEKPETEANNEVEQNKAEDTEESTQTVDNDDIDSLLNEIENENSTSQADSTNENSEQESSSESEDMSDDEIENMLSEIDGISDNEPSKEVEKESSKEEDIKDTSDAKSSNIDENDIVKNWTDTKINEGVIPLPADKDTKVVNQLNQVANDSEEKVSQIFDVLSLGLDNNNDFRTKITDIEKFMLAQEKLLASLNTKFPNIEIFKKHIAEAKKVNEGLESLKSCMNEEDMKIFEAMELMQFNDINRQKIERVMSVIRKLSLYLNNLFEDEYTEHEIAVAKHIHGDEAEDLIGDDLDKLIEEFGKNNN